jgi:hypothetical protein
MSRSEVADAVGMVTGKSVHNELKNKSDPAQVKRDLLPRPASIDISVQRPNVGGSVINGTQRVLVLAKLN